MSPASEQAAVELRLDWQANGIAHRNRQYFEKINFWRDIFPGGLSLSLPDSNGEWVSEDFPAGELVPPWREGNIHSVKRAALALTRRNGPPIELHAGRHYPCYIAAGLPDIYAGNMQPLRVLSIDGDTVTLDLNHPLAKVPLTVSARIDRRLGQTGEHGGRCNDVFTEMVAAGVGLETLPSDARPDLFAAAAFNRLDDRDDGLFYSEPRLVQHIDATAIGHITEVYGRHLSDGMRVLDLMSSWVSHLPDELDLSVTGLGLNAAELERNAQLVQRVVHDLNSVPTLPFPDDHFDAAVCTVSIEYLTDPVAVLSELARVLRPGAALVISFSDRWFPTKVIGIWGELHPFERIALVLDYFRRAGGFGTLATESVRGFPRPADDKYADQLTCSDPVFAVSGVAGA